VLPTVLKTTFEPAVFKLTLPDKLIIPASLSAVVSKPPPKLIVVEVISIPPVWVSTFFSDVVLALLIVNPYSSSELPISSLKVTVAEPESIVKLRLFPAESASIVLLKSTAPSKVVELARLVLIETLLFNIAAPFISTIPPSVPAPDIVFDVISPPRLMVAAVNTTPVLLVVEFASVVVIALTSILVPALPSVSKSTFCSALAVPISPLTVISLFPTETENVRNGDEASEFKFPSIDTVLLFVVS